MDEDPEQSFLPFLDVLFAAIGIFVILIFQALASGFETRAAGADLLLLCTGEPEVLWVEPGAAGPSAARTADLAGRLGALAGRLGRNPSVVLAYSAPGIDLARAVEQAIGAMTVLHGAGPSGSAPQVVGWPLAAGAQARERLVRDWLGPAPARPGSVGGTGARP